jgi:hypothetical protein
VNGGTGFSLLFKTWVVSSNSSYALACLGVLLMGALRQCLGCLRAALPALAERVFKRLNAKGADNLLEPPALTAHVVQRSTSYVAADTVLLGASLLLAYLNMLVAMAYDFGLLSSLVAGEMVAYFTLSRSGLLLQQHPGFEPACH